MKKLFNLLLIGVFLIPLTTYGALTDSLVSWWSMEETGGARVDDHGVNDLTDNNTVLYGTGIITNGADYEYSNSEYLSIDSGSQVGLDVSGDFSVSAWVYYESVSAGRYIISKGFESDGNTVRAYNFGWQPNTLNMHISSGCSGGGTFSVAWTPSTDTWYHLVGVYDASAGEISFYVNGSQQGTTQTGAPNSICTSASKTFIGSYDQTYYYHDGILDELGFWSRTLTTDEITSLYNAGAGLGYADLAGAGGGGGDSGNLATSTIEQMQENLASGIFMFISMFWFIIWFFRKRNK